MPPASPARQSRALRKNFSDAVVAPVLWLVVAGLPGAARLQSDQYRRQHDRPPHAPSRDFGWAAARLDDLVNLPASRLAALLLIAAAASRQDVSSTAAWRTVWLDAAAAPLAQCRLSGGGDGRRARPFACRTADLRRRARSTTPPWAADAGTRSRRHSPRARALSHADGSDRHAHCRRLILSAPV